MKVIKYTHTVCILIAKSDVDISKEKETTIQGNPSYNYVRVSHKTKQKMTLTFLSLSKNMFYGLIRQPW